MAILDGIRYAVETADVAYERLYDCLQNIARSSSEPTTRHIATAVVDAWAIVDSVHRFVDLVDSLPGLRKGQWFRLLTERTKDCLALRDDVQHLRDRTGMIADGGGQLWGYISWAEVNESGRYSGQWFMISPGSDYPGDSWFYMGPISLPFDVPAGRIRLNAFDRKVYLGRMVGLIVHASRYIEKELMEGHVRPVGPSAPDSRGADRVMGGAVEVIWRPAKPTDSDQKR